MISRRQFMVTGAAGAAVLAIGRPSFGQADWPQRPVTIIIGNPPGGDDDTLSRWLAETMRQELGQPLVVENRAGASTTIGATAVASAAPDGYTTFCLIAPSVIQTTLRNDLRYTLDSFEPVIKIGGYPLALLSSRAAGLESWEQFLEAARSADGITYGTGGIGTVGHLTAAQFVSAIEGNGLHIPLRNNPEAIQNLMGGFVQMTFASTREALTLQNDPNLRVLAVTSVERVPGLDDVPTMTELGYPQIDARVWYSYVLPAGTDPQIATRLAAAVRAGVESEEFQAQFGPLSFQTELLEGAEFGAFLDSERARFAAIVEDENISLQN